MMILINSLKAVNQYFFYTEKYLRPDGLFLKYIIFLHMFSWSGNHSFCKIAFHLNYS